MNYDSFRDLFSPKGNKNDEYRAKYLAHFIPNGSGVMVFFIEDEDTQNCFGGRLNTIQLQHLKYCLEREISYIDNVLTGVVKELVKEKEEENKFSKKYQEVF